jgi:phage terminase large subunit
MNNGLPFQLPAYGWKPRADQLPLWNRIIAPEFRSGTIVAHRRYGKDEIGLQATCVHAMSRVGSYIYALPEYEQVRKALWDGVNWRTQRTRVMDAFPDEIVSRRDGERMMVYLTSGSTVQFIGSDRVDSLVGGGQVGVVVSEAALSKPEFQLFIQPVLEESGGWMLRISTPRGKNHFHKDYEADKADQDAGVPGRLAAYMPATKTSVFPAEQLHRIKMQLIRKHGRTIGEAIFKQEYLCDFDAAVIGAVWGTELNDLVMTGRQRPCPHDRRFPVFTSWDIGVGDSTVILFWQEVFNEYRLIDAFEATGLGLDTYITVLRQKHNERHYQYAKHFGPHDTKQREWIKGVSRKDEAARQGLNFTVTPQTRVKTQIACGAQLINQMVVNTASEEVVAAMEHFKAWRFPRSKSTGEIVTTPLHDEHSHASSALCTFAVNVASKLGLAAQVQDDQLHASAADLGGGGKFDPRTLGPAPYSKGVWTPPGAAAPPIRGAFG